MSKTYTTLLQVCDWRIALVQSASLIRIECDQAPCHAMYSRCVGIGSDPSNRQPLAALHQNAFTDGRPDSQAEQAVKPVRS